MKLVLKWVCFLSLLLLIPNAFSKPVVEAESVSRQTLVLAFGNWCPYICDQSIDKLNRQGSMVEILHHVFSDTGIDLELRKISYLDAIVMMKQSKH